MRIAVLTSGGDAPGMNPAVRAVVRAALARGCEVLAVEEGYAGLVDGTLRPCGWSDVGRLISQGGTALGTARSQAFRTPEGRRRAVGHLARAGVEALVVIGGDGSLTGAGVLTREWAEHVAALRADGTLDQAPATLRLAGLVGSIDNDMVGTDRTIGFDSALHRIVDAVDALAATARSHQRSFVVEVMGRRCGHLALAAAICTDADVALIPEAPPTDWRATVADALLRGRAAGRRRSLVMLAEGATDAEGTPIAAEEVRAFVQAEVGLETRTTVLGHVQRGGAPSAEDRVMPTRAGVRAVRALLDGEADATPILVGTRGDAVVVRDLGTALRDTQGVGEALDARRFDEALDARGPEVAALLDLHRVRVPDTPPEGPRLLVAHTGAPAPGMTAAVATLARLGAARGRTVLAAEEGLRGLTEDRVRPLTADDVDGIVAHGSTPLGTNRWVPDRPDRVQALADAVARHHLDEVVIVGGFEALDAARVLGDLGVRAAVIPATISNNVPATARSLGADTALNVIVHAVDGLALSAIGARDRVFVVEVMGRRCGWLAETAAIGSGAEIAWTHEAGVDLARVQADLAALCADFDRDRTVGIALVADGCPDPWDAATLARVMAAESGGRFDTRVCVLGHLQQGGRPSPADRLLGARLAQAALGWLDEGTAGAVLVGLDDDGPAVLTIAEALDRADPVHRRPADRPRRFPVVPVYADAATAPAPSA